MTPATGWSDYNEMFSRFHGASPGLPHPKSPFASPAVACVAEARWSVSGKERDFVP